MITNYWPEKYRPSTLEELVLDDNSREYLSSLKEIPNLLFAGPPGVGKTSAAKILATDKQRLYINASDENGIDTIRSKVVSFAQTQSLDGSLKIIILDEADQISDSAQKALRSVMEEYAGTTRFILTCNYLFKIIKPLQSRCKAVSFAPDFTSIIKRVCYILKEEGIKLEDSQKPLLAELIQRNGIDIRKTINEIQSFSVSGELKILENKARGIAEQITKRILNGKAGPELRAYWIERENEFGADYHRLFKEIFEHLHAEKPENTALLLEISEGMYRDAIVVDKELNFYATVLKMLA
jgi:DNA polymerase III delta prime subunit